MLLNNVPNELVPREVTGNIFDKARDTSAIMRRATEIPVRLNGETTIPVRGNVPVAQWVGEGARKPLATEGVGFKTMSGKKIAVTTWFSEEVVRANPANIYDILMADLPGAIARQVDYTAVHGKVIGGGKSPFDTSLAQTSNVQKLGTADQKSGGIYTDFVNGEAKVTDAGYDYSGIVADPRLRSMLKLAVDLQGRPLYVDTYGGANQTNGDPTLNGVPVSYSKGVSGAFNYQPEVTDSGMRAIAGDWSQAVYGVGMDINIRTSNETAFVDESGNLRSCMQENLVFVVAEAFYGFMVNDPNAFVTYTTTGAGKTS